MNNWSRRIVYFFYPLVLFSYCLYSFTQVDLNLTLSSNSLYQAVQQQLIQLGYFNRIVSGNIYLILVLLLFFLYFVIGKYITKFPRESGKFFVILVIITSLSAFISYPAFSHDFFNYLFDARIVTHYGLNPYLYRALDFPEDLWVRFMHWTHRTYPYGPVWLIMTLPFSYLGSGKFILTLFMFKLMFAAFYLGNVFLIYKISETIKKDYALKAAAYFAFNPLIITEMLISPHNESLLLLFFLLSVYLLFVPHRPILSFVSMLASVAVKFVTVVVLPLYLIKKIRSNPGLFLLLSSVLLLLPLSLEIINRESYPWYFIPFISLSSLLNQPRFTAIVTALSFGALFRYLPFLTTGEYSAGNYRLMDIYLLTPVIIVLLYLGITKFKKLWM